MDEMEKIIDPTRVRCIRDDAIMMCMSITKIGWKFRCKCGVTAILKFTVPEMTDAEKFEEKFTRKNIYKIGEKVQEEKFEVTK